MANHPVLHAVQPHNIHVQKLCVERINPFIHGQVYHPQLSSTLKFDKDEDGPFCTLVVLLGGGSQEKFPFAMEIRVVANFRIPKEQHLDADFSAFLAQQAVGLLWPFARVYLSDSITKLGLPPLNLPWINVEGTAIEIVEMPNVEE